LTYIFKTYGKVDVQILKAFSNKHFLVPRLCQGTPIRRLCLLFSSATDEAEPLDMGSQAQPGNQLSFLVPGLCQGTLIRRLCLLFSEPRLYRFPGTAGEPVKPNRYYEKYIYLSIYS